MICDNRTVFGSSLRELSIFFSLSFFSFLLTSSDIATFIHKTVSISRWHSNSHKHLWDCDLYRSSVLRSRIILINDHWHYFQLVWLSVGCWFCFACAMHQTKCSCLDSLRCSVVQMTIYCVRQMIMGFLFNRVNGMNIKKMGQCRCRWRCHKNCLRAFASTAIFCVEQYWNFNMHFKRLQINDEKSLWDIGCGFYVPFRQDT